MGYRGLLLLACLCAGAASANTTTWTAAGPLPSGGRTSRIVINPTTPSTLYAAAAQGLYESVDSGATWTLIFKTSFPPDIAVDPLSPSTLYMAAGFNVQGGLYKSTDGGKTWVQIDNGIISSFGLTTDWLTSIAVDPADEGVVYAGSDHTGVYKSTDGGAHWAQINTGIITSTRTAVSVPRLVVDPVTPNTLYAYATTQTGTPAESSLFRSLDRGATWTDTLDKPTNYYGDVAIDPKDHTHVIACYEVGASSSNNSGATWTSILSTAGSGAFQGACAIDPVDSTHIFIDSYISLYVSSSGSAYTQDPNVPAIVGVGGVSDIVFDPATPGRIYLASNGWGILSSSDDGASWQQSSTGIPNPDIGRLREGADGILYLSTTNAGIFKSLDQGATWAPAGPSPTGSLPTVADEVMSFAQDPTTPAKLYAGTISGVYRSSDGGDSWTASDTGLLLSQREIISMAVDPEVSTTLYIGPSTGGSSWAGLFKSVDGGASWTESDTGLSFSGGFQLDVIAVDPHDSEVIYASPFNNGLFKSVDGGVTWAESDTGMGTGKNIYAVAIDPTDSRKVYISSDSATSIYKSVDGGATWAAAANGVPSYYSSTLSIDPVDPSILYLGGSYVSTDGASSWQPVFSGIGIEHPVGGGEIEDDTVTLGPILIDPINHTHLYAAGSDGNLYVHGTPATAIADGVSVEAIRDVSVSGTLSATPAYGIQTVTFSLVQQPGHGELSLDAGTGKFTYTPDSGYIGTDGFSFKVTDQWGGVSNTATVQVTVSDIAPTASDGSVNTGPDAAVGGTLAAAQSYSGQTLSFGVVSIPVHGIVSVNAGTGQFSYTPANGFAGVDNFTFQVTDQYGTPSNTATEQVTVNDVAPNASGASLITKPDTTVTGTLSATRGYSSQSLAFSLISSPAHGAVSLAAGTGKFTYTPARGYAGSDSFTFQVKDAFGTLSNVATISVTVNDIAPKAQAGSGFSMGGPPVSGQLRAEIAYRGQVLHYSLLHPPAHGSVKVTSTGAYTYTPARGYRGRDSFTYQATDQWGTASNTAVVKVTVL